MTNKELENIIREQFKDFPTIEEVSPGVFKIPSPSTKGGRVVDLYTNQAGIDAFNRAIKEEFEKRLK